MNFLTKLLAIFALCFSITGCWESKTDNAAEDVGESIEQSTDDATDAVDDAAEDTEDMADPEL